ncbi:hypothetical protein HUN41_00130 [Streptomyces phage Coruscant]|uniref:Uncharacterized protein n=1 Tax=Streptomyces phage Coruscant TaxID=2739834 RepID=A0A7G4AW58_9CAUD|nr:hypothetical protein PP454_gp169 [Streptomyces phage Coruscant]QMP84248.1 hypothetical protein HUN41_00130 [Streptomyces phage Coruscant]
MNTQERIERFKQLWKEDSLIEDIVKELKQELDEDEFQPKWIDTLEEGENRWHVATLEIIEIDDGEFISVSWGRAKTEMQEHEYENTEIVRVRPVEKVVSTIEWKTIDD